MNTLHVLEFAAASLIVSWPVRRVHEHLLSVSSANMGIARIDALDSTIDGISSHNRYTAPDESIASLSMTIDLPSQRTIDKPCAQTPRNIDLLEDLNDANSRFVT